MRRDDESNQTEDGTIRNEFEFEFLLSSSSLSLSPAPFDSFIFLFLVDSIVMGIVKWVNGNNKFVCCGCSTVCRWPAAVVQFEFRCFVLFCGARCSVLWNGFPTTSLTAADAFVLHINSLFRNP